MKSVEAMSSPLFADSVVMAGEMMARTAVTAIVILNHRVVTTLRISLRMSLFMT